VSENGRRARAVADHVAGFFRGLAQHARAEVLFRVLQVKFLGDRHAVVADDRRAPLFLYQYGFRTRTKRHSHCVRQQGRAAQDLLARRRTKQNLQPRGFKDAMHKLIEDLKSAAPAAFQSEDYQTRRGAIDETFQKKQFEAFTALREKAAKKSILLLRTPVGFAMAPAANGEVVPPDQFNAWPEEKRAETQAEIAALEKELERIRFAR